MHCLLCTVHLPLATCFRQPTCYFPPKQRIVPPVASPFPPKKMSSPLFARPLLVALAAAAAFAATPLLAVGQTAFPDVWPGDSNVVAIEYLADRGVIVGYPDGSFRPNRQVNRAEAVKILLGAANIAAPRPGATPFVDTPQAEWFTPFVAKAKDLGIISGEPSAAGTAFVPARSVSRVEFIKMMLLVFEEDLSEFEQSDEPLATDADEDAWYASYLRFSRDLSLLSPDPNGRLWPMAALERREASEVLYRYLVLRSGGPAQKYLNLTESRLVRTFLALGEDENSKALAQVERAVDFAAKALEAAPQDPATLGTADIADGFLHLCLGRLARDDARRNEALLEAAAAIAAADRAVEKDLRVGAIASRLREEAKGDLAYWETREEQEPAPIENQSILPAS